MAATESTLPLDWFDRGNADMLAAQILLAADGPLSVVAFHLQQAVEKHLKGYLLSQGWSLRRIHDLEVLIREAIDRDGEFAPFLESCQRITEYYIESRYPTGFVSPLDVTDLQADLTVVEELVALIRYKVAH